MLRVNDKHHKAFLLTDQKIKTTHKFSDCSLIEHPKRFIFSRASVFFEQIKILFFSSLPLLLQTKFGQFLFVFDNMIYRECLLHTERRG